MYSEELAWIPYDSNKEMKKELTPLEALEEIIIDFKIDREALDIMDNTSQKDIDYGKKWLKEREDIVKKSLKALNFIKEEIEFGFEIVNNQTRLTLTARGVKVMSITIDKKKYNLLKEVLGNE